MLWPERPGTTSSRKQGIEQVKRAWTAWKRLPFAGKIRLFGYGTLLIAVVELAVVSSVYD